MSKLPLFVFLILGLPVLKAEGTLDCGKYPTVSTPQGPTCHRVGILPWFVGVPGAWETELRLGASGDTVELSYISSLSLKYADVNLVLEDAFWGSKALESVSGLALSQHRSHWVRILGVCHALFGQCPMESVTGSMIVRADASSAAALEGISAFGVYKYTSNDSVVSQTASPVIFVDEAAARWSAVLTETQRDQQGRPDATLTSFAVANLSPDPQAVLIRVYDESGQLSASAKTPILDKALGFFGQTEVLVGGVYADTLANVLGINLLPSPCPRSGQGYFAIGLPCAGPPVFRGTVVFEGEKGGKVAPVVFRFNGSAMTTVPVKAE